MSIIKALALIYFVIKAIETGVTYFKIRNAVSGVANAECKKARNRFYWYLVGALIFVLGL